MTLAETKEQTQGAETEERIFKAALNVFAAKGKAGARMQQIADEAGINKAMLHYYFRSKEKLYEAVFEYVFRRFAVQQIHSTLEHAKTYKDTLRAFINGFIDAHQEDLAIIKLMANENLAGGTTMGKIIARKDDKSPPSIFINKTREAIECGEIRPVDPHHTVLTIISSCVFFFIWAPTIKERIPHAGEDWSGFVEQRKKHIFEMLYYGLAMPGTPDVTKTPIEE